MLDKLLENAGPFINTNQSMLDWVENQKRLNTIKNLGVYETAKRLLEKEGKTNEALADVLNETLERLENEPEYMVYEDFISALSPFNYLNAVDTELSAAKDRTEKYKQDIDLMKIVEVMKQSKSYYLVPLIEDAVNDFIEKKTEQSKDSLVNIAMKYSYDPFVRSLIEILNLDKSNLDLIQETAQASVKSIYSPLMYLKENLVLFNVNNRFYIKKGNHIQKLNEEQTKSVKSDFKNLCSIINDGRVVINENSITIYHGNDTCQINNEKMTINEEEISLYRLKKLFETAKLIGDKKAEMYNMMEALYRNYNNIASIDFAKHIELNENENAFADIFKLNQKVYINLRTPNSHETFYKNVNPIQSKNIILENLNYDITPIFKDVMPKEQQILREMEETKKAYQSYIDELNEKINVFESSNLEVADALREELEDIKQEYKEYTRKCDNYQMVNEDFTVTITDDKNNSHTVVIPTNVSANANANNNDQSQQSNDQPSNDNVNTQETNTEENPDDGLNFDDINVSDDELEGGNEEESAVVDFEEGDEEVEESFIDDKFNKKYQPKEIKKTPKVFFRKKKSESINESYNPIQITDNVTVDGKRGQVTGVHTNGNLIVAMGNGSTITVIPQKVKKVLKQTSKSPISLLKFDEKTLKALYEQAIRCGVFVGNTPVKIHNCFVNYAEYKKAGDNDQIHVLVEGEQSLFNKSNIRLFENELDFANPSDYVEGVIINPETGEAVQNVLIHAHQYTSSMGTADEINVLVDDETGQRNLVKIAKGLLKTTAI